MEDVKLAKTGELAEVLVLVGEVGEAAAEALVTAGEVEEAEELVAEGVLPGEGVAVLVLHKYTCVEENASTQILIYSP